MPRTMRAVGTVFSPDPPDPSGPFSPVERPRNIASEAGDRASAPAGPAATGRTDSAQTPRIIIVDDDPTTRNLISHFLRKEQMSITRASGAREALAAAKEGRPDLMIIDFVVQGMGGVELLSLLKAAPETDAIPVIVLFPFDEEEAVIKALEAGGDFIRKPFSPRILVAKVKKILKDAQDHAPDHRRL